MGARRLRPTHAAAPPVVLLVGGSDDDAELCARAASPLPVVRTKHIGTATDRVRSLRPVLVVVAPEIPQADASAVKRVADERAVRVVGLPTAEGAALITAGASRTSRRTDS